MCYFETTRECNQDCPGCMTRKKGPAAPPLSTDEAKALVIDEVVKICPAGSIAFSGGEFLLRTDAPDLIAHAAARGLHSFVNTNGRLLEPGLIAAIKKASRGRITFGFSLDSVDRDVQNKCRPGGLQDFLRHTALCDEAGVKYFVLVTVSRANMGTLAQTSEFLRKRNIPMIRSPFVPRGGGVARRDLMFTREDMETTIHPVLRANPLAYVSYTPFFASPDATRIGLSKLGLSLGQLGCQAARGFVGVSPEGDVAPCVHLLDSTAICGNVKRTPLSELFSTNPVLCALREGRGLKGRCGRCRYRTACGGCRARAFYASGDCFAEDPTCFFKPDEGKKSEYEDETDRNARSFFEFVASNQPWRDIFAGGVSGRIGASIIQSAAAVRKIMKPLRGRPKYENTAH
jgi:radical SAM protein with 4Fe4S-binding SPASM domain